MIINVPLHSTVQSSLSFFFFLIGFKEQLDPIRTLGSFKNAGKDKVTMDLIYHS